MTTLHPRELALQRGHKTYTGVSCATCGGTLRHTNNWSCVECQRSKARAKPATRREPVIDRDQERRDMRARLAVVRAAQSAKQRRAMGLPG